VGDRFKGIARDDGEKGQTGERPRERETLRSSRLKTLGFTEGKVEGLSWTKSEKGRKEERDFFSGVKRGKPERSESSREQKAPTRTNPLGSREGHGFSGGRKPLKRRSEAVKGLEGSARAEREIRKGFSITGEEKSSEERSPRALGTERGSPG